jgi:hypothetical protein
MGHLKCYSKNTKQPVGWSRNNATTKYKRQKNEKCIPNFGRKKPRIRDNLEDLGMDGRVEIQ